MDMHQAEAPEGPIRDLPLLREQAGVRDRTVDDHMFRVGNSSFRLQIFAGNGVRPVAVATQTDREGAALMNGAERFVAAVWQRHCPDEQDPPIFIAHQLLDSQDLGLMHYGFTVVGTHTVGAPRWGPRLSEAELCVLVGGPVDVSRGDGYIEPARPQEGRMRYAVAAVLGLPRPDLHGDPPCMPSGTPWWRRVGRQVAPRRRVRGCCSYHDGDWGAASEAAIRALARFEARPTDDDGEDDQLNRLLDALRTLSDEHRLDEWTMEAAASLFTDPIQPLRGEGGPYINGRHRSQAMLDAGTRRTVIGIWEYPGDDA